MSSTLIATIPTAELYWGRLGSDSSHLTIRAAVYRFERFLPLSIDQLQVVSTRLANGSVVLVAIEITRLRDHLAARPDIGPDTWALIPDSVPDHYAQAGITDTHRSQLNLLSGAFEPAPRRTKRLLTLAVVHAGCALAAIIAVIGINRHAHALQFHAEEAARRSAALIDQALPVSHGSKNNPAVRLIMEVRTLEQAAHSADSHTTDIAGLFTALWKHWPSDMRVQTETLTASADRLVIRGSVPTLADAESLAHACAHLNLAGDSVPFRAEPLQAQSGDHGATFLITLARAVPATGHP